MVSWFQKNLQKFMLAATVMLLATSVNVNAEVTAPVVPKGKGEQCVEPTGEMRKNHMEMLKHQRDETMHNGIRTKKHALKNVSVVTCKKTIKVRLHVLVMTNTSVVLAITMPALILTASSVMQIARKS